MKKLSNLPLEELTKIPLFTGLGEADILPLLKAAHEKHLHSGGYFYLQGDPADCLYVLVRGRLKLSQAGPDGKQVLIQVVKPVHAFGLVAMTASAVYPVSAEADRDSLALYWNRHELMVHVRKMPQMALNAMRIMADQLQELQDRFRQMTTQRVEQRLAQTLIRLAAQSGRRVEGGILIDHAITRQDLAEMSGTTVYTASRILSHWHTQALVITGRGKVIIHDPHGLAHIIESSPV